MTNVNISISVQAFGMISVGVIHNNRLTMQILGIPQVVTNLTTSACVRHKLHAFECKSREEKEVMN